MKNRPSARPKQLKAFRDRYLAALMIVAAFLTTLPAFSQIDTSRNHDNVNTYLQYSKSIWFNGALRIPRDTPKLAVADSGSLAYKGGAIWQWSGYRWDTLKTYTIPPAIAGKNIGSGYGIYKTKISDSLQFRAITNGSRITITPQGDSLIIDGIAPDGSETKVVAGANMLVTGNGTTASPYVLTAVVPSGGGGGGSGLDTVAHDITLKGKGVLLDPLGADTSYMTTHYWFYNNLPFYDLNTILTNGNSTFQNIYLNNSYLQNHGTVADLFTRPEGIDFFDNVSSNAIMLRTQPTGILGSYTAYLPEKFADDTFAMKSDLIPFVVSHDSTLLNDGTASNPLKVDITKIQLKSVVDTMRNNVYSSLSSKLSTVSHNSTLIGNGAGTSLGVDSVNYIGTKKNLADSSAAMRALWALNWKQGGNSFGANGVIGTLDNFPFSIYQNGLERARYAATTGNLLVNTTSDNGDKFQVAGSTSINPTSTGTALTVKPTTNASQIFFKNTSDSSASIEVNAVTATTTTKSPRILLQTLNGSGVLQNGIGIGWITGTKYGIAGIGTVTDVAIMGHLSPTAGNTYDLGFSQPWRTISVNNISMFGNTTGTTSSLFTTTRPIAAGSYSYKFDENMSSTASSGTSTNHLVMVDLARTVGANAIDAGVTVMRKNVLDSAGFTPFWAPRGYSVLSDSSANGGLGIGVNALNRNASAMLQVNSTTKGVLFPRMTTTQRDAIPSPAEGLVIYNLTTHKVQYFDGTSWVDL